MGVHSLASSVIFKCLTEATLDEHKQGQQPLTALQHSSLFPYGATSSLF